jgi:hypothetical protein
MDQSKGEKMPVVFSFMKLHNPTGRIVAQPPSYTSNLERVSRDDAPIAQHQDDAHELYELPRERVTNLEDVIGDQTGRCKD